MYILRLFQRDRADISHISAHSKSLTASDIQGNDSCAQIAVWKGALLPGRNTTLHHNLRKTEMRKHFTKSLLNLSCVGGIGTSCTFTAVTKHTVTAVHIPFMKISQAGQQTGSVLQEKRNLTDLLMLIFIFLGLRKNSNLRFSPCLGWLAGVHWNAAERASCPHTDRHKACEWPR